MKIDLILKKLYNEVLFNDEYSNPKNERCKSDVVSYEKNFGNNKLPLDLNIFKLTH